MKFQTTRLSGVMLIATEAVEDDRGWFARAYCAREFAEHGLNTHWPQCNLSHNRRRGTLRGMHYQEAPHGEIKLVRCLTGRIYDVVVDLRQESPTFRQWLGVELSAENRQALYVPEGMAHGFVTLEDDTNLFYHMSSFFHAESARGIHWDDATLAIDWPLRDNLIVSVKDRGNPKLMDR